MADVGTGWERGNRTHFDQIVLNYDKIRPEYPDQLLADVFSYAGADRGKKALEIGAGTGKATLPFLNAGYEVTAVEAGANMADFLREKCKGYKDFNVITAAFEDAVLEDNSYDLLYAASAFHWVDAKIGCPKAMRLLKSGGVIALFRYNLVRPDGEELYKEIQEVYQKHYYSYYTSSQRPARVPREAYGQPAEIMRGYGFEDLGEYGFEDVTMKLYDGEKMFGADGYIALLDTLADHRSLPEGNRTALYAGIREAILGRGGRIKEENVFQLYMGRKP